MSAHPIWNRNRNLRLAIEHLEARQLLSVVPYGNVPSIEPGDPSLVSLGVPMSQTQPTLTPAFPDGARSLDSDAQSLTQLWSWTDGPQDSVPGFRRPGKRNAADPRPASQLLRLGFSRRPL